MSTESPAWWTVSLLKDSEQAASRSYPNEVCGLYYVPVAGVIRLHVFSGTSTPWRVDANPNDVVQFVYQHLVNGATVLGTFHVHPTGQPQFSKRDDMLAMWGEWHTLAIWRRDAWHFTWARRVRAHASERHVSSSL